MAERRQPLALVVDDEPVIRLFVRQVLESDGIAALEAEGGRQAMEMLGSQPATRDEGEAGEGRDESASRGPTPDLLVTDLMMPGGHGMELLRFARRQQPDMPAIVMTAHGRVSDAVQAFQLGVSGFLEKPFEPDQLRVEVRRALVASLRRHEPAPPVIAGEDSALLGGSEPMGALRALVARVAPSDATVLLLGESGTGKDLVARELHRKGAHPDGPFVAVNCGAIPESLVESELFGHVRGAFTGAVSPRQGRFDAAVGGTLFLDEIGEMPAAAQVRLLRTLETRTWEPLGGTQTRSGSFRVVAATNRDLEKAVEEGRFRRDLFYRLNVVTIRVPALREHRGDIARLVEVFVDEQNRRRGGRILPPDRACLELLERHPWPGNVRELRHLVERIAVLKDEGPIAAGDLPDFMRGSPDGGAPPAPQSLTEELARYERELITVALAQAGGNRQKASQLLGINRTTLVEKIKRLGLRDETTPGPRR